MASCKTWTKLWTNARWRIPKLIRFLIVHGCCWWVLAANHLENLANERSIPLVCFRHFNAHCICKRSLKKCEIFCYWIEDKFLNWTKLSPFYKNWFKTLFIKCDASKHFVDTGIWGDVTVMKWINTLWVCVIYVHYQVFKWAAVKLSPAIWLVNKLSDSPMGSSPTAKKDLSTSRPIPERDVFS